MSQIGLPTECCDCGSTEKLFHRVAGTRCPSCDKAYIEQRVAMFDGDTRFLPEAVCPHCGHVHSNSYEMEEDEQICGDCGRTFFLERHVSVTHSTSKVDPFRRRR